MATRPFKHSPLNNKIKEIRLLTITGNADGPIKCCLKHFDLSSYPTPDYRALSYTWGPESPSQEILINGCSLIVRRNLYDFLESAQQRLVLFAGNDQYEQEVQWLWIDQICVDQSLTTERNHQVQMMAEIFQRASYVYIWLGPADELTERVMATIKLHQRRHLERRIEISRQRAKKTKKRAIDGRPQELCTEEMDCHKNGDPSLRVTEAGMQRFFGNPYWTRLWIIQEILLARYLRVICGNTYISWEELKRFCCNNPAQESMTIFDHEKYPKIAWLAEHAMSAASFQLFPLIRMFSTSICQEPRDKVYGLQGLVEKKCRVKIDYGLSIKSVFWRTALAICGEMDETPAKLHSNAEQDWLWKDSQDWTSASGVLSNAMKILREDVKHALGLDIIDTLVLLHQDMGIILPTELPATRCQLVDRLTTIWDLLENYHITVWKCWYDYRDDYFKHIDQKSTNSEIVAQLINTCCQLLDSSYRLLGYFARCDSEDPDEQDEEEEEEEEEEEGEGRQELEAAEAEEAEQPWAIDNRMHAFNMAWLLSDEQRTIHMGPSYLVNMGIQGYDRLSRRQMKLLKVWKHKTDIRTGDISTWRRTLGNIFCHIWQKLAVIEQQKEVLSSYRFSDDAFPNKTLAVITLLVTL